MKGTLTAHSHTGTPGATTPESKSVLRNQALAIAVTAQIALEARIEVADKTSKDLSASILSRAKPEFRESWTMLNNVYMADTGQTWTGILTTMLMIAEAFDSRTGGLRLTKRLMAKPRTK